MGMFENMSVAWQMRKLQDFIEANKDKPLAEQLDLLKKEIEEVRKAAESGWL